MPTIVAMCPYCRAGGVRAPAASIGASATCPRCHSSFTVLPTEVGKDWAANPANFPTPAAETVPNATIDDVTEPSPVVPATATTAAPPEPRPARRPSHRRKRKKTVYPVAEVIAPPRPRPAAEEPEPEPETFPFEPEPEPPAPAVAAVPEHVPVATPRPALAAAPEADEEREPMDYGLAFALGSLILVGPTVLASQLPFGRFLAAGLGLVGLLGGVAALGTEGRTRLMAAAAAALHAVILLVVVFAPSVLGLDPWLGHPDEAAPVGPFVVNHATGQRGPLTAGTWIDAGNSSWEYKDLRVTVVAAQSGPLRLVGPGGSKRQTKESYYRLQVRVANAGVERKIDLTGWAAGEGAEDVRVTDAAGKPLAPAKFDGPWQPEGGKPVRQLFPGHPSDVTLVFAAPPPGSGGARVELPGAALGVPEQTVKFRTGSAPLARPTP